MNNNVFFVGPMGAGKTTIGRQIAKFFQQEFFDSDKEIELKTGASISLIFELEKEEGFRKRETAMIDILTQKNDIILATGGGAILKPENREFLSSRGYVIYLQASVDYLLTRTAKDKSRPLLQTKDPEKKLRELMKTRDPLYREVAHDIVQTNGQTVRQVVSLITDLINKRRQQYNTSP